MVLKNDTRIAPSRRGFLRGLVGFAGLTVAVAACGQTSAPASSTVAPAVATRAPAAGATSAPAGAATSAAATSSSGVASGTQVQLTGAGSTFDAPLFSKAFDTYNKQYPNIKINYQSVGSGAGIQQFTNGTVDFGASDAPMSDQQITAAGGDAVHIPITLGPVAVAYNLPGMAEGIKIDGPTLASIFLGTITSWNDPALTKLNPDKTLPNTPILVVHRSDGSGTTDIFTSYLSFASPDWKTKVGFGTAPNWPIGLGGKGSEGVAGQVKQTPGGIGYFELSYAVNNKLTSAAIGDGTGNFLLPTTDASSACAAATSSTMPGDLRLRIAGCGTATKGAYPISGFSWVILHKEQKDQTKGAVLVNMLWWMIHTGQSLSKDLSYAPLPDSVVKLVEEKLRGITFNGQTLLTATS